MIQWRPGITIYLAEKEVILQAFKFYQSNKTATAHALGISTRTLDNKLERYESDRQYEQQRAEHLAHYERSLLDEQRGKVPAGTAAQIAKTFQHAASRFHMESAEEIGSESDLSLPEREEVQEMLSTETARRRPGRPRQRI